MLYICYFIMNHDSGFIIGIAMIVHVSLPSPGYGRLFNNNHNLIILLLFHRYWKIAINPIPMPSSKFSPIQIPIPIIITQLISYPCVTALLELYLQSDCAIKVFQSLNAGIVAVFHCLTTISSLLHIKFCLLIIYYDYYNYDD